MEPAPIRLMAQPLGDASAKPPPPVEIFASTHTPTLRGEVATFAGVHTKNAPQNFGELLRESLALGEESS
jgi:hypothetical protein